jgi:hypothetical protein
VDRWSLEGKLTQASVASAKGTAGPLRAYDGKVYWAVGNSLWRFVLAEARLELVTEAPGTIADIAIGAGGKVYLGTKEGGLYEKSGKRLTLKNQGAEVTGLFFLESSLFVLREKTLENAGHSSIICSSLCRGLERSSSGAWITASGAKILEVNGKKNRVLANLPEAPGRISYVYRRDPKDDFLVIPLPDSHVLRAFGRGPAKTEKLKKAKATAL